MYVFDALAVGQLRRDGRRSFVAVCAVAFGVAVWLCVRLTAAHAVATFATQTGVFGDEADVVVERPGGRLSPNVLAAVRAADGVATALPELSGAIVLDALPNAPDTPRVIHLEAFDLLAPLPRAFEFRDQLPGPFAAVGSGPDPALLVDGRGVIVSPSLAMARGLHAGAILAAHVGARRVTLRVAAIFPRDTTAIDDDVAIVDVATAQTLFATPDFDRIACTAIAGSLDRARAAIAAVLPRGVRVVTANERRSEVEQMLAAFAGNANALADLALVVAAILTYDAIAISVVRRRGHIGTLRALGSTRRAIAVAFIAEGMLLGAIGALLGVAAGTLVARAAGAVAAGVDPYAFDRWAPLESFALGVVAATCAAVLPALAAAALQPVLAWSGRPFGAAPGPAFAWLARLARSARVPPSLVLGFALLASVPRRVAVSVASLAAAVGLAVAVLTFAASFRTSLATWSAKTLTGDVTISPLEGTDAAPESRFTSASLARIRSANGVASVSGSRTLRMPLAGSVVDVTASDSPEAPRTTARAWAEIDTALAARMHVRIGDALLVPGGAPNVVRVGRIVSGDPFGSGKISLDRATFLRATGDATLDTLVVDARPGTDLERLRATLERTLAPRELEIVATRDVRARVIGRFDTIARETFAIAAVALVVGAAGIGVTLSALVFEFRDELRLLRYAGLTRRGTRALVFVQATCVGLLGALVGSACGIALAAGSLLADQIRFGSPLRLDVPFATITEIVIASVALAIAASIEPARVAATLALRGVTRTAVALALVIALATPLGATRSDDRQSPTSMDRARTIWRVLGHLHARDGSAYDVATTFFRYDLTQPTRSPANVPWESRAFYSGATSILNEDAHTTSIGTRTERDGTGFASADPTSFDVRVNRWSLRTRNPNETVRPRFALHVETDAVRVDLALVAAQSIVALGTNGFVRTGSCRTCLARAVAIPRLTATGTLVVGSHRIAVTGTFWIDRERGDAQLAQTDRGWERFTIQFDDGRGLIVRFIRDAVGRIVASDGSFIDRDGHDVELEARDLELENPLKTVWRNARGIEYPSLWDLYVRRLGLDLALVPDVPGQEVDAGARGARFYLGSLTVERANPGPRDRGRGYAESTGYDRVLRF